MKPEELKEYLGIVVDMEKNIFMQNQTMKQWEKEIAILGKAREFHQPAPPRQEALPKRLGVLIEPAPEPPSPPEPPKKVRYLKRAFWIAVAFFVISILNSLPYYSQVTVLLGTLFWVPIFSAGVAVITAVIVGIFCDDEVTLREYYLQKKQYTAAVEAYPSVLERHRQHQQQREQKCQQEWRKACEKVEQSNQAAMLEYQKKLDAYYSDIEKDQHRVMLENVKKGVLQVELSQMKELNAASKKTLQKIYDKNIIFSKYRNMVMVCSLYEYICAGRCDTLEGHSGAYNILEFEIRIDKIVIQLDRVIEMLGRIQQSQYMVYSAIQDANRQSAKILESTYEMTNQLQAFQASNRKMLGGIQAGMQRGILAAEQQSITMAQMTQQLSALQATSALTAYQTERTRTELHYMNRMNYLSGKNDEVFFNLPPM